jgi:hypothetical protein
MHVVIATAEPRGAYHLRPLAEALEASAAAFTHLTPYPEPVQGDPVVEVSTKVQVLAGCDRVVVTGGTFSAWTELVARHAVALGKPVIFSELAYVSEPPPLHPPCAVDLVTALSPDSARVLRHYLGVAEVQVTGTPALDDLPPWRPVPGRVVLLSTSDMAARDPDQHLVRVAQDLESTGWEVLVRLHPREDPSPWERFTVVAGETVVESAAAAQVVLGYPGTAHVVAAAVGVPVLALAPTAALRQVFTPQQAAAISGHARTAAEAVTLVSTAMPPDPVKVAEVVGPVGGAAQRLVAAWTGPL